MKASFRACVTVCVAFLLLAVVALASPPTSGYHLIKTQPDNDSITYDPASKLIFTFNGDSKNSSVIDPSKETVVKTIDMGGAVEQPLVDGKGMLYDNNEETNEVVSVDTHALAVKARWPVKPAGEPVAISIDTEHRRIFSGGRGPAKLVMMDADNVK